MAYQPPQPRPQQAPRIAPPVVTSTAAQSPELLQAPSAEEWILFSPQSQSVVSQTATSHTPRTANLSRISDFGSFGTGQSDQLADFGHESRHSPDGEDGGDEDGELDSLDDGLHAFQGPLARHLDQSGTILPSHDGLGTFPNLTRHPDPEVQDQIWQHERHNHNSRYAQQKNRALTPQEEQNMRIEQWRLDQSRAVMEEIEREARRRRRRAAHRSSIARATRSSRRTHNESTVGTLDDVPPSESFWHRITRRVIKDLIGLDQKTLAIIFGEDFMTGDEHEQPPESSAARRETNDTETWERKLLSRIARELGILVDQINAESTRAFSTYGRTRLDSEPATANQKNFQSRSTEPVFRPTLGPAITPSTNQRLWGIEEEPEGEGRMSSQAEEDYWQRDPSIRMIFGYLVNRFSSSDDPSQSYSTHPPPISPDTTGPLPASWATEDTPDPSHAPRADLIRRNHPLVSQSTQRRRETLLRRHLHHHQQSLLLQGSPIHHRRAASSSCASQSTNRRSKRSLSTGSRNYWDFPSGATGPAGSEVSVASGPAAAASWGDV